MLFSLLDLRCVAWLALAAGIGVVTGCRPADQITRYTVPKPELIDPTLAAAAGVRQQTLAAMIEVGDSSWFFKLMDDPAVVEPSRQAFLDFVKSVKFSAGADPRPQWKLPPGWEEEPGNQIRLATIRFQSAGQPVTISVIPAGGDVLNNVNRWRKELALPPLAKSELASATETFQVDGRECTSVSLVGTKSADGMGGAPFAPFAGGGSAAPDLPPSGPPSSGGLTYEVPKEWSPAPGNAVSAAAFQVVEGNKKVEITVSQVGGDWLSNANRWREQVNLPPMTLDELAKSTAKINTFGTSGDYIEAVGRGDVTSPETILGVRAVVGGDSWFIKLKGDRDLAAREKARFEAFVKSVQLK